MQEIWVQSLDREDPLEEGTATHSRILAWRIPGQRSLVGHSPQGHKESDLMGVTKHTLTQGKLNKQELRWKELIFHR